MLADLLTKGSAVVNQAHAVVSVAQRARQTLEIARNVVQPMAPKLERTQPMAPKLEQTQPMAPELQLDRGETMTPETASQQQAAAARNLELKRGGVTSGFTPVDNDALASTPTARNYTSAPPATSASAVPANTEGNRVMVAQATDYSGANVSKIGGWWVPLAITSAGLLAGTYVVWQLKKKPKRRNPRRRRRSSGGRRSR